LSKIIEAKMPRKIRSSLVENIIEGIVSAGSNLTLASDGQATPRDIPKSKTFVPYYDSLMSSEDRKLLIDTPVSPEVELSIRNRHLK
jgi:hypothetical protein